MVVVQTDNICRKRSTKENRAHLSSAAMRAYSDQRTPARGDIENKLITELLPMVRRIAGQVAAYLHPPLSLEDMISAGTVGLVRAARDFDPSHRAEFQTYAYIRIKGAILDELRNWSFIPSNVNKRIRDAQQLSQKIMQETGNMPSEDELAQKLGTTVDKVNETFGTARAKHFVSLDGGGDDTPALGNLLVADQIRTPDEKIERTELIEKLADAIQTLKDKQRQVILLYYQQQLTMKQIAEILQITESRVSQLHASALFSLSVQLGQWKDGRL